MRVQLHMWLASAVLAVSTFLYLEHKQSFLHSLAIEDSVVENLTAVLLLVAGSYFLLAATKRRGSMIWLGMLATVMFFVAGEEISWGQRIFGWTTPEIIADVNTQSETTFHNIQGIHGSIRLVAILVITAVCAIIPATRHYVPALRDFYDRLRLPAFPVFALPWVGTGFALMIVPRVLGEPIDDVGYLDEIGEMALAIAFLLFALAVSRSPQTEVAADGLPASQDPALAGDERLTSAFAADSEYGTRTQHSVSPDER